MGLKLESLSGFCTQPPDRLFFKVSGGANEVVAAVMKVKTQQILFRVGGTMWIKNTDL